MRKENEKRLMLDAGQMQKVFGGGDVYLKKIEKELHVEIVDRDGELKIMGEGQAPRKAADLILALVHDGQEPMEEQRVNYAIELEKDKAQDPGTEGLCECHQGTHDSLRHRTGGYREDVSCHGDGNNGLYQK